MAHTFCHSFKDSGASGLSWLCLQADVPGGCHLLLQLLDVEAPSLRLPLVELISNVAELPAGRKVGTTRFNSGTIAYGSASAFHAVTAPLEASNVMTACFSSTTLKCFEALHLPLLKLFWRVAKLPVRRWIPWQESSASAQSQPAGTGQAQQAAFAGLQVKLPDFTVLALHLGRSRAPHGPILSRAASLQRMCTGAALYRCVLHCLQALQGAAPILQDLRSSTSDRRLQNSLAQAVRQLGFQSLPFEHLPPTGDLIATA